MAIYQIGYVPVLSSSSELTDMNEDSTGIPSAVSLGLGYNVPCLRLRLSCEKAVVLSCYLKNS